MYNFLITWGMVIGTVILNSFGALAIKYKINQFGPVEFTPLSKLFSYFLTLLSSPLIIAGVFSIFGSAFLWMIALSRMDISLAYPVSVGLNFLIVISLGVILYSEPLNSSKIIAIGLILFSIVLLYKNP